MIVEVASFQAEPGKEDAFAGGITRGIEVIRQAEGCRSIKVHRGIETPSRFILYIEWDSVEAHLEGFRAGPLFPRWREHINGLFSSVQMEHYDVIAR